MELCRERGRPLCIGHRGAPALAPENTLASLTAALDAGVDLVEIDVRIRADGALVLAHGPESVEAPEAPRLDDALALLGARTVGVLVDLKSRGCERAVAEAVRRAALTDRAVVASFRHRSLRMLAAVDPDLPRALSYPEDRFGLADRRTLAPLVRGGTATLRRLLPGRIGRWLDRAGAAVASLHAELVSPAVVERCHAHGAAVFAWTVNDAETAERLIQAGLDGIITDDPRIFSGLEA